MSPLCSKAGNTAIMTMVTLVVIAASVAILATPYYPLAMLPGCGILFFMFLTRWPGAAFFIFLFLIPFGAYRGLKEPYDFIELPWLIAFGLLLIIVFKSLSIKRVPKELSSHMWPLLFLFFSISTVSALLSPHPALALKNLVLLAIGCLYIILTLVFVSPDQLWTFLPRTFAASISLTSFLACIGYFFNIALFAENIHSGGFKRGIGGTTDPNNLALVILFVFPFIAQGFLTAKRLPVRIVYLLFAAINIVALATTFSRSGAMVLALIGLFILIENRHIFRPRHLGFILSGAAAGLLVFAVMMPEGYIQRQMSLTSKTDKSIGRRTSYLFVAWDAVVRDPVFGSGPGTFKEIYSQSSYAITFSKKGDSGKRYAHNSYLEILVGTGGMGLTVFLGILALTLADFTRAKRRFTAAGDRAKASMTGTYRLAFLAILIYLLFLSDTLNKYMLLLVAVSQIMVRCAPSTETENAQLQV